MKTFSVMLEELKQAQVLQYQEFEKQFEERSVQWEKLIAQALLNTQDRVIIEKGTKDSLPFFHHARQQLTKLGYRAEICNDKKQELWSKSKVPGVLDNLDVVNLVINLSTGPQLRK